MGGGKLGARETPDPRGSDGERRAEPQPPWDPKRRGARQATSTAPALPVSSGGGRSPPRTWSPVMAAHSPPPGWRLALDINSSPLAPGSHVRRGRILRYCLPGLVFGQMRSLGRWQLPPEWPGHLRVFSTCGPRTSFPFSVRGVSGRGYGSQSLQGRAEGPSLAFCSVKSGATFKSSF